MLFLKGRDSGDISALSLTAEMIKVSSCSVCSRLEMPVELVRFVDGYDLQDLDQILILVRFDKTR